MRIGVVGASARAAVHSLARARISAWSIDQFADRDLKRVAECVVCPPDAYPDAIPLLAEKFPPGPVLYTGGLENHPQIVSELASRRELWGNPPGVLAPVRDPFVLLPALAANGFAIPRLVPRGEPCPSQGRWLRKPLRSGGGVGIRFARPGEPPLPTHYFQEYIDGTPMSAFYGGTTLLGVTEQLVGEPWLHASGFTYCGNIAIPALVELERPRLSDLGLRLLLRFGVSAHKGIDYVERDGEIFPLEVNPRYTASAEVIEHGTGHSAFQQWVRSANGPGLGNVGKAVYYAPRALTFPQSGPWDADLTGPFDPWKLPTFADVPEAGAAIAEGHPVLTFFAAGSTPAEVRERLQSRAAELDHLLREAHP
jgi:predicted ATP-grasp superfamily ATP-dependent carboligase